MVTSFFAVSSVYLRLQQSLTADMALFMLPLPGTLRAFSHNYLFLSPFLWAEGNIAAAPSADARLSLVS